MRPTTTAMRAPRDIYQEVTDTITAALKAGVIPWRRPWRVAGAHRNAITRREYRGANAFLLNVAAALKGYSSPLWLTFKQAKAAGGSVRAGERATLVVFWRILEHEERDPRTGRVVLDAKGEPVIRRVPVLRHFNVFNVQQCDFPAGAIAPADVPAAAFTPDERAEQVWRAYEGRPALAHGGDAAFYVPRVDRIQMPPRERFESAGSYYHVLFHEAVHSTGAETRLNRATLTQAGAFGSPNYSQEELVAELGASMLLAEFGLSPEVQNAAAYVAGWLKALRDDRKMLVIAAAQAEKAARWIRNDRPTPESESAAGEVDDDTPAPAPDIARVATALPAGVA